MPVAFLLRYVDELEPMKQKYRVISHTPNLFWNKRQKWLISMVVHEGTGAEAGHSGALPNETLIGY
jgi:hypothetical protein